MWKNISALRVTGIISYRVAPTTSGASRPVSYELKVSNKNANEFQQQHHYELRFSFKKKKYQQSSDCLQSNICV